MSTDNRGGVLGVGATRPVCRVTKGQNRHPPGEIGGVERLDPPDLAGFPVRNLPKTDRVAVLCPGATHFRHRMAITGFLEKKRRKPTLNLRQTPDKGLALRDQCRAAPNQIPHPIPPSMPRVWSGDTNVSGPKRPFTTHIRSTGAEISCSRSENSNRAPESSNRWACSDSVSSGEIGTGTIPARRQPTVTTRNSMEFEARTATRSPVRNDKAPRNPARRAWRSSSSANDSEWPPQTRAGWSGAECVRPPRPLTSARCPSGLGSAAGRNPVVPSATRRGCGAVWARAGTRATAR